ncbi:TetR/AcrR family transcriptional regulator [Streptomyces tsukubensis]|uniref:HTH tetR-type domain-containing protein n=1 Tax=Streptomyces tsukubensis TaxID=83656 RepID=A0A1V4AFQ7_9ACTN|nr:TetR/AcrR family transcriptional regulator [Streptomyces tsukubensis]OON82869.1 hypothetical protein B1H18_02260 [Streptomyces tsukubensis]QFR91952.1 TetR family transcriptional regulator [Streptomyces tsukubensis]
MTEQRTDTARMGRPPLTERRKAATRLEIARAAVRLFTAQGVAATSAGDIAREAGISTRTLWRYFPVKEQCVRPLLSPGVEALTAALRESPPEEPLTEALYRFRMGGAPAGETSAVMDLVRLTRDEPGLRAVWLQTHLEAEPRLAEAIAERTGEPPDGLRPRVRAAMINVALRAATEDFAWDEQPDRSLDAVVTEALLIASEGLSGSGP